MKEEKLDFKTTALLSLAGAEHSAPPLITGWRSYSRQSRPTGVSVLFCNVHKDTDRVIPRSFNHFYFEQNRIHLKAKRLQSSDSHAGCFSTKQKTMD